ncbi:MAG: ABC transporter family substrate-binding protein [Streptosporangiaceae bacterium]
MLGGRKTAVPAAAVGILLFAAACGGGGGGGAGGGGQESSLAACDQSPNICNSAQVKNNTGTFSYVIEKNVEDWNLLSITGNVFETAEVLDGVLPYAFDSYPDLKPHLNTDLLESAKETKTSPQTFVYKIKDDAVWSDGTPVSAKDFIYAWKVQNGEDCPDCAAATNSGYNRIKSIKGSDGGKTVTVTMKKPFTDWKIMFGPLYPAHIAEKHGGTDSASGLAKSFKWFQQNVPPVSAGPFEIKNFKDNVAVTEVPNPKWWGEGAHLKRLIFRIITDATQEPTALANNEVQAIYPQPEVDLVQQVEQIPNVSYYLGQGLIWEHFDLNLKNPFLKDEALRDAMFTAVDRQKIINKTVGQFKKGIKPLNNHNFVPQEDGYTDTVTATGHGAGNLGKAKQILKQAGYKIQGGKLITPDGKTVKPMTIRYTTGNTIRKNECELFAQQVKPLGVTVNIKPTDDLGGTLGNGDYDVIVFAWVGTPFPFAGAGQLWLSTSGSNFGHWVNKKSDALIKKAVASTDRQQAAKWLNQADKIMAEDSYVLPLYQKPTFLAVQDKYANIRDNATNVGPPYNAQEWGVRASSE